MDFGPLRRPAVALIAAYAMALQALLMAFGPVPAAGFAPNGSVAAWGVLCGHNSADGKGPPAQHDLPCAAICAAMSHGITGAVPPDVVVAIAVPHTVVAAAPAVQWVPPPIAVIDTHAPRGPPLA